jgi:hypothetical protein
MEERKNRLLKIPVQIFCDFKKIDVNFLIHSDKVVTWVHQFTPQRKQPGIWWKQSASPTVSVFCYAESVIHVEFMPRCTSVNVNASWETLLQLREDIRRKRPGHVVRFDPAAR